MPTIQSIETRLFAIPLAEVLTDANRALSVDEAICAAEAVMKSDILWFEGPAIPGDYDGHRRDRGGWTEGLAGIPDTGFRSALRHCRRRAIMGAQVCAYT
jgi:hypothetical protein